MADQGCLLGFLTDRALRTGGSPSKLAPGRVGGGARGSLSLELPRMWHSERPNCFTKQEVVRLEAHRWLRPVDRDGGDRRIFGGT